MQFRITSQQARTYTRGALLLTALTSVFKAAVGVSIGYFVVRDLTRTLGLPPRLLHAALAVLALMFLIDTVRDLYLILKIPSEMGKAGVDIDLTGSADVGTRPANPTALFDFEQRMVDLERPFAWAGVVIGGVFNALVGWLIVIGLRINGPSSTSGKILYFACAMAMLILSGGVVSSIYTTWARYSIALRQKQNVVVKPVEFLLLIIWLSLIFLLGAIFVATGNPLRMLAGPILVLVAVAVAMIWNYRQTVSLKIVNPIDVAPITIDPSETIAITIAGVTLMGPTLLQPVGFGRRLSQQNNSAQSGRRLNPWGQNALLVSETRLYFIYVPIGMGDQGDPGSGVFESMFSGRQIRAKLDDMLASMTLRQIYESDPINFAIELNEVSRLDVLQRAGTREYVAFVDRKGGKLRALIDASAGTEQLDALMQRIGREIAVGT